jgi:hypothetical protein
MAQVGTERWVLACLRLLPGCSFTIAAHKLVIPALRRLRQEDHEFKVNLGCIERPCLKKLSNRARHWWLTPAILATWETKIGSIRFEASLGK